VEFPRFRCEYGSAPVRMWLHQELDDMTHIPARKFMKSETQVHQFNARHSIAKADRTWLSSNRRTESSRAMHAVHIFTAH
jgi:hypothetical protein